MRALCSRFLAVDECAVFTALLFCCLLLDENAYLLFRHALSLYVVVLSKFVYSTSL